MAVAVAVSDGLVTPKIENAHLKTLRQISSEVKDIAARAKEKKLKPSELSGSTFTISTLGMFGIENFFAIINPPNAAILAIGTIVKKPVVDADDNIVVGHRMRLGLSGDHRVVDGATGARYLAALKELAEKYRGDDLRIIQSGETEEIEERYLKDGREYIVAQIDQVGFFMLTLIDGR